VATEEARLSGEGPGRDHCQHWSIRNAPTMSTTIRVVIEKLKHTGAHADGAKVDPGAVASGSPKIVEGEVVKPAP